MKLWILSLQNSVKVQRLNVAFNATTGALLWGPVNRTEPRYHEVSVARAGEGYYVEQDKDTNTAFVYNLKTGAQVGSGIQA